MRKIDITISDEQYKLLMEIARREDISLADALGKCISLFENHNLEVSTNHERILSMAGKYNSRQKDLASNHATYIERDICDI